MPVGTDHVRAVYAGYSGSEIYSPSSAEETVVVPKAVCLDSLQDSQLPMVSSTLTCGFLGGPPDALMVSPPNPALPLELDCNGQSHALALGPLQVLTAPPVWPSWDQSSNGFEFFSWSIAPVNAVSLCGRSGEIGFGYAGDANLDHAVSPSVKY